MTTGILRAASVNCQATSSRKTLVSLFATSKTFREAAALLDFSAQCCRDGNDADEFDGGGNGSYFPVAAQEAAAAIPLLLATLPANRPQLSFDPTRYDGAEQSQTPRHLYASAAITLAHAKLESLLGDDYTGELAGLTWAVAYFANDMRSATQTWDDEPEAMLTEAIEALPSPASIVTPAEVTDSLAAARQTLLAWLSTATTAENLPDDGTVNLEVSYVLADEPILTT